MIRAAAGVALLLSAGPALAQHAGHIMPPGMKMDMPMPAPKPAPKPPVRAAPKPPVKAAPRPASRPASRPPARPPATPTARQAPRTATPARPCAPTTAPTPARTTPSPAEPMDGSGMADMEGMDEPNGGASAAPPPDKAGPVDQSTMDHSSMDHGSMAMPMPMAMPMTRDAAPTSETPPPPGAGSGPARAADAIWGAGAMRAARKELATENGGGTNTLFMADRAELLSHSGRDGYLWDVQGYYGGDLDKLWLKSEGEGSFGEAVEQAEVQALWSHAITPWFDAQVGVRQDFAGPDRTHLVAGVQGLAPYLFEVDAAAFLSTKGDLTARVSVELDQRITQRLILQPRAEVNLAAQDVRELGIGGGLDSVELGLRLRYEIRREFAPYVGVAQEWRVGGSRGFARARGADPSVTSLVGGVRLWF